MDVLHPHLDDRHGEAKERVRGFFSQHAEHYARSESHGQGADLDRLVELLQPEPQEVALDVATAAGHTALRLALRARLVIGLDYTPAMGGPFRRLAAEKGLGNVRFQVGDAERLPFADASFDLVTSRRAPHHFPRVEQAVREMARVLRPGGRLGIVDMTALDPAQADLLNALEAARDDSHVRALTPDQWRAQAEAAGLTVTTLEVHVEPIPWERWLAPVPPDSPQAARADDILRQAPAALRSGLVEDRADGRWLLKRRVVMVARRLR
ncbi:MAG: methyltransferase domain-containing protein [Firmicutes bacterium]|nr:methyltransferase domain-containing protein [Bacillota bacterium]